MPLRVAVVTSQFPGRVSTFFARDLRALIEAGVEVEVFPIYPLDASLWRYVPDCLGEDVLPRTRVHHLSFGAAAGALARLAPERRRTLARDTTRVLRSAAGFGVAPLLKTAYVVPKAAAWARQITGRFDHVFAYWGNYAGTCAWLMARLLPESVPFSLFLHAGTDLFRDQVFLREKVLAASTIVTECEFNRRFLRDLYPDIWPRIEGKVRVNHMGVDLAELAMSSAPRAATRVIGVGRLDAAAGKADLPGMVVQMRRPLGEQHADSGGAVDERHQHRRRGRVALRRVHEGRKSGLGGTRGRAAQALAQPLSGQRRRQRQGHRVIATGVGECQSQSPLPAAARDCAAQSKLNSRWQSLLF